MEPNAAPRAGLLEKRARVIASQALAATRGFAPREAFKDYVTDDVFRRLALRSQGHPRREPDPGYRCRIHLQPLEADVVEATVVAACGQGVRAIGMRLECRLGHWRAVELTIV
jgi:hypothetical protein